MKHFFVFLFLSLHLFTKGQDNYYANPVKIPLILSGSFAELRSNHFHSGIDIKTNGVTGIPVYAVAEGVITRIVVSPSGFGRALYIDHPNGTTSVYGHLRAFRADIEEYVKNYQYQNQTFRVDLQVAEDLFEVKKEEFLGESGNSGSSGGPHLHFEIRDTPSQHPLNPLKYPFPVKDNTPPRIYSLMIVPLGENAHVDYQSGPKTYPVVYKGGNYHLRDNPIIPVYGNIGFALHANDFFDESHNKCGIYSMQMKFNGEVYYSFRMDRFSFAESRYINSHIHYEEYIRSKRRFHKTWTDPANKLSIYDFIRQNGIIEMDEGGIHHVRFELTDTHENASVLEFNVESKSGKIPVQPKKFIRTMKHGRKNQFRSGGLKVDFPENSFYTDIPFEYTVLPGKKELFTRIHVIHKETVPLHDAFRLSLKPRDIPINLQPKALLVSIDPQSEKVSAAGGSFSNGWVSGKIRNFGQYAVALDTVAPEIIPLSIRNNSDLTETNRIRFRITDELSGITEIEGKLDGQWALFEYDAKNNLITHYFDAGRFELQKRHHLELKVTDYCKNETTYEASFWK